MTLDDFSKDLEILDDKYKRQHERVKWIMTGLDYKRLTEREAKFVESVELQSDNRKILSSTQMTWLEDIYDNKKI